MKRRVAPRAASFGAVMFFSVMAAAGQPCAETTVISDWETLAPEWRTSLHDLVAATSKEGHLWSCTGARLSLIQDASGDGATLRIEDRKGRSAERHVRSPADLVPTGEALLASSEFPEAIPSKAEATAEKTIPSPTTPPKKVTSDKPNPIPASTPRSIPTHTFPSLPMEPRVLLDVLAATRYTAPLKTVWGGFVIRGAIPFGDWSVALRGRFDFSAWVFDSVPRDFSMSEASIGLGVGRRLFRRPFELHTMLDLSLNVVTMEGGEEPDLAEASGVDPRVGIDIRTVWPISNRWRFVVALDGAFAPMAAVNSAERRIDDALPPLPSYSVGMSLGLEIGL